MPISADPSNKIKTEKGDDPGVQFKEVTDMMSAAFDLYYNFVCNLTQCVSMALK